MLLLTIGLDDLKGFSQWFFISAFQFFLVKMESLLWAQPGSFLRYRRSEGFLAPCSSGIQFSQSRQVTPSLFSHHNYLSTWKNDLISRVNVLQQEGKHCQLQQTNIACYRRANCISYSCCCLFRLLFNKLSAYKSSVSAVDFFLACEYTLKRHYVHCCRTALQLQLLKKNLCATQS